jgi:DNA repair photolyase
LKSGFVHKLLCDGPTFTTGDACVYKCSFCYVPSMMARDPEMIAIRGKAGRAHSDLVIRRRDALARMREQLVNSNGAPRYTDPGDNRCCFSSPLVDVAANMDLVRETIEACRLILTLTHWQIRLLSKSSLLAKIAEALAEYKDRVIYGLSTGTLVDGLARIFEEGTPLVSKRIESLHWLQDNGFRTYGMACPILPQADYGAFAAELAERLRVDRCEHVWAEALNERGESLVRTVKILSAGGFVKEAAMVQAVGTDAAEWEEYSRAMFLALLKTVPADKLRFMQYVTKASAAWWKRYEGKGAVVLGKAAETAV